LDNRWTLSKKYRKVAGKCPKEGYWMISGQFLKGIGKPLGMSKCNEKSRKRDQGPKRGMEVLPNGYKQKHGNSNSFPLKRYVSVYFY
jgi:hypothetical protein